MSTTVFDPTYPEGYTSKYPIFPEDSGTYIPGKVYNLNDIVRHLGSVFRSIINSNTTPPATWDKESGIVYFNTDYWKILVNGTADYILHSEINDIHYDIDDISDSINSKIDSEISTVNTKIDNTNRRITETEENLQDQIDNVASSSTDITLTLIPDIVFSGSNTIMVSSALNTGGTVIQHKLERLGTVIASSTSESLSISDTVNSNSDVTYLATATINGQQKNKSITLKVVNKIYYGSGNNPLSANTPYTTPKDTPVGTYNINVINNGDYIFMDFPSNMMINSAKVNGFDIPFEIVTSSRSGYRCYKSINTYDAGNITIDIE